jgi:2-polyprenyl-3-methyl-5-hydroxy-6-metoxy-1,4-benzoquinol methylase
VTVEEASSVNTETDFSRSFDFGWISSESGKHHRYTYPAIFDELARSGAKRVIDIGSGNGVLCKILHDRGYDVVGVEYDISGVQVARESFPEISFYNYKVEDDPAILLEDELSAFYCIISTEVIEHLFAPHLLVEYAAKVMGRNGTLIITTPYHGYWKNLLLSIGGRWDHHLEPFWLGGHIKFWSRRTLTDFLIQNGFDVIRFRGVGRLPLIWKGMVITARKRG